MSRVGRQKLIEQSLQDFVEDALAAQDFPMPQIEMLDLFEQRDFGDSPIDKEYVALGYNFDEGGAPAELGTNLRRYRHIIEIFVIATAAARGQSLAYAIRDTLEGAERVPLKDVTQAAQPVIDVLLIDPVSAERQAIPDPEPWEEFVWLLRAPIIDEFDPSF